MSDDSQLAARLAWRCRRGMKELDLVLAGYLKTRYPALPPHQQQAFHSLLDVSDDSLWRYFYQNLTPDDPNLATLVLDIRSTTAHRV